MKGIRIKLETIKKIISDNNGQMIKESVKNNVRYITIKCDKDDNVWTTRLGNLRKGQWCKDCHNRDRIKPINIDKIKSLLEKKGFDLLTISKNITHWSKIELHCPKHNRTWTTSYGQLERGANCKFCGHGSMDFEELSGLIKKYNASFIKRVKTTNSVRNIVLKCNIHNHEWRTNSTDLRNGKRLCVKCSKEARKTSYEKIKEAVENNNGALLSVDCCGSLTRINVKCSNGHKWNTCYDYINQGYWCPECRYKIQPLLHSIIKEIFPEYKTYYNYRGFDWLKMNKKRPHKMEIDIWVPDIKLAIEYDGIQHFTPIKFSSKTTDDQAKQIFYRTKRCDRKKTKLISQHSNIVNKLIRFNYKDKIDKENIIRVLKQNKIKI